jgi:hypothetical protein
MKKHSLLAALRTAIYDELGSAIYSEIPLSLVVIRSDSQRYELQVVLTYDSFDNRSHPVDNFAFVYRNLRHIIGAELLLAQKDTINFVQKNFLGKAEVGPLWDDHGNVIGVFQTSGWLWRREEGARLLGKAMMLACKTARSYSMAELPVCVLELDLRRPARDMLGLVSGNISGAGDQSEDLPSDGQPPFDFSTKVKRFRGGSL